MNQESGYNPGFFHFLNPMKEKEQVQGGRINCFLKLNTVG
mgnify:FL=1